MATLNDTGWDRLKQSLAGIEDENDSEASVNEANELSLPKTSKKDRRGSILSVGIAGPSNSRRGSTFSTLVNELMLPKSPQKERRGSILSVGSSNSRRGSTFSTTSTASRWKSVRLVNYT